MFQNPSNLPINKIVQYGFFPHQNMGYEKMLIYIFLVAFLPCFFLSCSTPENRKNALLEEEGQVIVPTYSKGFYYTKFENYLKLSIVRYAKKDTLHFYLSNDGESLSVSRFQNVSKIKIPAKRWVCTATTHVALLSALNATDKLIGFSGLDFVSDSLTRQQIVTNKISEVGEEGHLNLEIVAALEPDVLVTSGWDSDDTELLKSQGTLVVPNLEWKEEHPLGRTEWIKVFGLLLGKEQAASAYFEKLKQEYQQLTQLAKQQIETKPSVMVGMSYQGDWYIPGGDSFMAKLIDDAGGHYLWNELSGIASVKLDFEEIYQRGISASVWINTGRISSLEGISSLDARLKDFKAFQEKRVFNNDRRQNPEGWNDFFESSVVNPHLILTDLIKVMHPHLLQKDSLYYYRPLL